MTFECINGGRKFTQRTQKKTSIPEQTPSPAKTDTEEKTKP